MEAVVDVCTQLYQGTGQNFRALVNYNSLHDSLHNPCSSWMFLGLLISTRTLDLMAFQLVKLCRMEMSREGFEVMDVSLAAAETHGIPQQTQDE